MKVATNLKIYSTSSLYIEDGAIKWSRNKGELDDQMWLVLKVTNKELV